MRLCLDSLMGVPRVFDMFDVHARHRSMGAESATDVSLSGTKSRTMLHSLLCLLPVPSSSYTMFGFPFFISLLILALKEAAAAVIDVRNVSSVYNTTLEGPMDGFFERSIKDGVRFLKLHGAGNQANLRTVIAKPVKKSSRIATEFALFEIDVMNREKRLDYITRNDGPRIERWKPPRVESDDDHIFQPWRLEDYDLSLEEAIYRVESAGYPGPWDTITVFFPIRDPLEQKAGREAYIGFHTDGQTESFPAIGMESREVFVYTAKDLRAEDASQLTWLAEAGETS